MNKDIIINIITKNILPNNNKYMSENIICYLEKDDILIEYKNNIYKLSLINNKLSLYKENQLLNTYPTNIKFDRIIEYIKNIHKI